MNSESDPRITAFLAWRRRRALEAGVFRPEQLLDEWVFHRMMISAPKDIYELEKLRLLTAPLFHQYGDDLFALIQGRPTQDERPKSHRHEVEIEVDRSPRERRASAPDRSRRSEPIYSRAPVRADTPAVSLHSVRSDRKTIEDFAPDPSHLDWKGKPFEFGCSTMAFKFWETEFLEQWGSLVESIASGAVPPLGEDELSIAALTDRTRKAAKEWEQAWVKIVLRRAYESN